MDGVGAVLKKKAHNVIAYKREAVIKNTEQLLDYFPSTDIAISAYTNEDIGTINATIPSELRIQSKGLSIGKVHEWVVTGDDSIKWKALSGDAEYATARFSTGKLYKGRKTRVVVDDESEGDERNELSSENDVDGKDEEDAGDLSNETDEETMSNEGAEHNPTNETAMTGKQAVSLDEVMEGDWVKLVYCGNIYLGKVANLSQHPVPRASVPVKCFVDEFGVNPTSQQFENERLIAEYQTIYDGSACVPKLVQSNKRGIWDWSYLA